MTDLRADELVKLADRLIAQDYGDVSDVDALGPHFALLAEAATTLRRLAEAGTQQPAPSVAVPSPPQDDVREACTIVDDAKRLLDLETAFFVSMANNNVPPDVAELLLRGDPMRSIPPRVVQKAIKAALRGNQSDGGTPNATTIAAIEELERGGGEVITAQQMDAIEQAAVEGQPLSGAELFERHTGFKLKITDPTPSRPEVSVSDLLHVIALWLDDEGLNISMSQGEELARALKAKYHMEGRE